MTEFAVGKLRFNLAGFPKLLADLANWPTIGLSTLLKSDAVIFLSRRHAVDLLDRIAHLNAIQSKTGIDAKSLRWIVARCHADMKTAAFRASALPFPLRG